MLREILPRGVLVVVLFGVGFLVAGCSEKSTTLTHDEKDRKAIESVIVQDKTAARRVERRLQNGGNRVEVLREYLHTIEQIDKSRCPIDFQEAWVDHVYAWADLIPHVDKYDGFGGLMTAFIEGLAQRYDGDKERTRLIQNVRDTYRKVEKIALRYGYQIKR